MPHLWRGQGGQALLGLTCALAGMALLLGVSTALAPSAGSARVRAGARSLAHQMRKLGVAARADGRARALVFPPAGRDEPLREAFDGNGNGLHREEIAAGTDPAGPPFTLARDHRGVFMGRPDWPDLPDLPPSRRRLSPGDPAVRFGASRMAVFGADGRATPGSLFVTDGREAVCALSVVGGTGRLRVWCFDRVQGRWRKR